MYMFVYTFFPFFWLENVNLASLVALFVSGSIFQYGCRTRRL